MQDKIAFLLPRNTAINDFGALGYEINAEVEHCFYNHKLKAITAYFGSLANLTADEIEAFVAESWRVNKLFLFLSECDEYNISSID